MREEEIRELRPLTALRLLTIWREEREGTADPLERSLRCNARVLAECCFREDGERVFPQEEAVLEALTARQMEDLLRRLSGERGSGEVNTAFDPERFAALEGI